MQSVVSVGCFAVQVWLSALIRDQEHGDRPQLQRQDELNRNTATEILGNTVLVTAEERLKKMMTRPCIDDTGRIFC